MFNDVLAFTHCKLKRCDTNVLTNVISSFYSHEDLMEARELLFALIDPDGCLPRVPMVASAIVKHFYLKYDVLKYSFIALDLNHIPCIDVSDHDAVLFFLEQHRVQCQLQRYLGSKFMSGTN